MAYRSRVRDNRLPQMGSLLWITLRYASQNIGSITYCDDYVDNWTAVNPFSLAHWVKNTPTINGVLKNSDGQVLREFVSYPPGIWTNAIPDPRTVFPSLNSAQREGYAWEILAATNPSRPYVNMVTQIGELRDLPALVKGFGEDLLKGLKAIRGRDIPWYRVPDMPDRSWFESGKGHNEVRAASKAWIIHKFAIAPMVSEVRKLFKFTDHVNRRVQELTTLRAKKVLRKRCSLASDRIVSSPTRVMIHSEGASIYQERQNVFTRKVWGTAQYRTEPGSYLNQMLDPLWFTHPRSTREMRDTAVNQLLGCTTYSAAQAAWELVPWSWLADWFTNAGTMLAAMNNTVGVTHQKLALMCTSTTEVNYRTSSSSDVPSWITLTGPWEWKCTRKERWPVAPIIPFPTLTLPILTGGQLSILGSLAAIKSGFVSRFYRMDPKI